MADFLYKAFYCEENIWQLCQNEKLRGLEKKVVLITNDNRTCQLWQQSSAKHQNNPVYWDYHVILLVKDKHWVVWDLDSNLPLGCPVQQYFATTFNHGQSDLPEFNSSFQVIEGTEYINRFTSDRKHMIKPDNTWFAPPPTWPIINQGIANPLPLATLLNTKIGHWIDYNGILKMFA